MYPEIDVQLKNLQAKLQQLLKQYQLLQKENEQLKKQLELNKNYAANNYELNQSLHQKMVISGLVQQQNTSADKMALQKKIDKYLQEIDKCLLLLNASV
jgi:hypothetical protein